MSKFFFAHLLLFSEKCRWNVGIEKTNGQNRWFFNDFLAEDMGLEPTGLLHLTAFPMRLLSHSVNPPSTIIIYHKLRKIASSFCYVFKTFFCSRFLMQNKTFTLRIILYLSLFHRATANIFDIACQAVYYTQKKRRSHICFHEFSADRTRVCPVVSCKSCPPPKNH